MAARLDIIGPIFGFSDNSAAIIKSKMAEIDPKEDLDLFFHTPGGSVWEAKGIFDLILQHQGTTRAHVSLAMSAGSYAAMAADELIVSEISEFMIHSAMTHEEFMGNASKVDAFIAHLQKQKAGLMAEDKSIAAVYAKRAGVGVDQITQWMAETTTWRGRAILKAGFATKFETIPKRKGDFMNFDLRCYKGGESSAWHKTFDEGIDPEQSWIAAVDAHTLEATNEQPPEAAAAKHEDKSEAHLEKIRQVAKAQAAARSRNLAITHPTAI